MNVEDEIPDAENNFNDGKAGSSARLLRPFDPGATFKPTPPLGMVNASAKDDNHLIMAPDIRNNMESRLPSGSHTAPLPRNSRRFPNQQNNLENEPKRTYPPWFFHSPGIKLRPPKTASFRTPHKDLFACISDEIMLHIFQWLMKRNLAKCARVSTRWNRLSMDESLWRRVDMGNKKVAESTLHKLIDRGTVFLRLAKADIERDLYPSDSRSNNLLLYPAHNMSKLTHLDLSMAVYESADLVAGILERCRCLVALSLEHGMLNIRGCLSIGQNPNLEILNLALCKGICFDGLDAILEGCRRLKELNIAWAHLTYDMQSLFCLKLPETITRLNISGCRSEEKALNNEDIDNLVCSCPGLIELDISDCTKVTGVGFDVLLENLEDLAVLSCSRCYGIEPIHYTCCTKLKELNIHGCITDDGMKVVGERLKGVKLCETYFSTIARPTVGIRRTSIWEHRVRDE